MKKLTYLFLAAVAVLFSCTKEEAPGGLPAEGEVKLSFVLEWPEFNTVTRAEAVDENKVTDLSLLIFDVNGNFIKRCHYDGLENEQPGARQFEAKVPEDTKYIHFVANYPAWDSFDELGSVGKNEREIIPALETDGFVFWGRHTIIRFNETQKATIYRNQAKVTVSSDIPKQFKVGGFAVCRYETVGTVAPFDASSDDDPFAVSTERPTLPVVSRKNDQTADDCDLNPKFMCENDNFFEGQTYVIIQRVVAGQPAQYYKVQLLDSEGDPYPIVRNCNYHVLIREFDDIVTGSSTFEEAKNADPSNNVYAEVIKEAPTVKDKEGNELTVSPLNILMTEEGQITIRYAYTQDGEPYNTGVVVAQDDNEILSDIVNDANTGTVTAKVSAVTDGHKQGRILFRAGKLSRVVTVVSSERYEFTPVSISPHNGIDQDATLTFHIPADVPETMFPLECRIATDFLYPVAPDNNMLVVFEDNTYKYTYIAEAPGEQDVRFKTALAQGNEIVTIENPYFRTAHVLTGRKMFYDVTVNANNLVGYGAGHEAVLNFLVGDNMDLPFDVFIATGKLQTDQATPAAGGYTYQVTETGVQSIRFTSKTDDSAETVTLSADGYGSAEVSFEVYLTRDIDYIGGKIERDGWWGIGKEDIESGKITSSVPGIVPNFNATSDSRYDNIILKAGAKLSDRVTLSHIPTVHSYTKTLSIREILKQETIRLEY